MSERYKKEGRKTWVTMEEERESKVEEEDEMKKKGGGYLYKP